MTPTKNIDVKDINADSVSEIKKAEGEAIANGSNTVRLNFQAAKGEIPVGIFLLDDMHKSPVDFTTHASGELTLASILLLAGGKFGERSADASATFNLFEDSKKAEKKRKTLTASEKNSLEILDKLSCGRKARIKAFMLSGSKATAAEMVSLGLIDKTEGGFVDKFAQARIDAKKKK
ncbi:MAG: hypothetical protein NTY74_12170 [Ignavibacteriae bacterium]|nr:hypothetical protein [Ignavibacteriota bacterium]